MQTDGCWGRGDNGQLGDGQFANSPFPVQMLNVQNASCVAAGDYVTCVVDQGKARCTGKGYYVGRSSIFENTNILVDVEGLVETTVEQVFAGYYHTCLITKTGEAKCWGWHDYGQLGNVDAVPHSQAFPITGFETNQVGSMSLGIRHTCLINTSGQVYCAGINVLGELGRGTIACRDAARCGSGCYSKHGFHCLWGSPHVHAQ